MDLLRRKTALPAPGEALPGRDAAVAVPAAHHVLGVPLQAPPGAEVLVVGMGCFWGAERVFWSLPGVLSTWAGYAGGQTPNPTYEEVCTGRTGHAEVVAIAYDPARTDLQVLLRAFWEQHDPTQGMRQGNDVGTQYRSAIWTTTDVQLQAALESRDRYQESLTAAGFGGITTEVAPLTGPVYYAEEHHQQYLSKNPGGYCNHGFCQVGYSGPSLEAAAGG